MLERDVNLKVDYVNNQKNIEVLLLVVLVIYNNMIQVYKRFCMWIDG